MFTTEGMAAELRQAEIISNLRQPVFVPESSGTSLLTIPYSIILSQDCDIVRDFKSRSEGGPEAMNGLLLYELATETHARALSPTGKAKINSSIWRSVEKNNHERYHCFLPVPPSTDLEGSGLPILVLDFRRYFTLSAKDIERQLQRSSIPPARRRCRVDTLYREHLQARAAFYFQRIALPDRAE